MCGSARLASLSNPGLVGMLFGLSILSAAPTYAESSEDLFRRRVAPILERRCVVCHNDDEAKGGLSLASRERAMAGGDSGAVLIPGDIGRSALLAMIDGERPEMPKSGEPLSDAERNAFRDWVKSGAGWPAQLRLEERPAADTDWWALRPLSRPPIPVAPAAPGTGNAIDAFIVARLRDEGLQPSPPADRRTLIRRLYYDLLGLPPAPDQIDRFVNDPDPRAYERLVDQLLEQPQYGERWARHWLDVVHYADTHGYDKDKLRPNAWPYRDYVIRSLNADRPYGEFVRQQLAGDVLYAEDPAGIEALGFISAGPWDFVGHAEVPESKLDGQIARLLDRDDMVSTSLNALMSTTVQCARCHHHKFDPISQEDYYSLQAVFAALDRADRAYDVDPSVARMRREFERERTELESLRKQLDETIRQMAGPRLAEIDKQLAELAGQSTGAERPEFGYHSAIETSPNVEKWVQIDLGEPKVVEDLLYVACHDTFNNIGAGFGFPRRYRIEAANDERFAENVRTIVDHSAADVANPGVVPQAVKVGGESIRFIRITATRLALRQADYIFAMAEVMALDKEGVNLAAGREVQSLDSIEAPVRWQRRNLVDGYYYGVKPGSAEKIAELGQMRHELLDRSLDDATRQAWLELQAKTEQVTKQISDLPARQQVYAGTIHHGSAPFTGTGGNGGKPREIRVLRRGDLKNPGKIASPGALPWFDNLPHRFDLPPEHAEGQRRAALARWVTAPENGLTWRSIVNRVWLYHFGRGLVDSPNDFGRMGQLPTHPELLDWLAVEFRDGGGSLKALHRLICNSATYRQSSEFRPEAAERDASNQLLWRMNRRRLEAEAIRDCVLFVAGKLDPAMYGPGFWDFVLEKPEHSPHYEYDKQDPNDPKTHRRSIYRFVVRSAPDPFMESLDCADPSLLVDKRNETINALGALAMLNNKFMVRMSQHFAARVEREGADAGERIDAAFRHALGRDPLPSERDGLIGYANQFGLANACRLILNLNEFSFVD